MRITMTRQEAAEYMKVSLPTIRKFLKKHADVLDKNRIDANRLEAIITEESEKSLQKKGK